ncbi:MAG: DUF5777 family beta-barrel protein [Bacteroidota bacterium]
MRRLLFGLLACSSWALWAQDDLLAELGALEPEAPKQYAFATFKGTKLVNGSTVEMPGAGVGQFIVGHRFGALNDKPLYNLFGMDVAQIRFEYSYNPVPWLNVGMGRSSGSKTYDGFTKLRLLRQSKGGKGLNSPVSVVWYSSMTLTTVPFTDGFHHFFSDRLAYAHQLMVARKLNDKVSLQVAPTLVHFNLVPLASDRNDQLGLGLSGRYKLTQRMALTAETMFRQTPLAGTHMPLSVGLDLETGGHVFQFHVTNARSMADPQWMMQTPGSWANGDLFLGFNISRVFTHVKPKELR